MTFAREREARRIPMYPWALQRREAQAAWLYQAGFRVSDISAACGLSTRALLAAVDFYEVPRRSEWQTRRECRRILPMLEAVARDGAGAGDLEREFGISPAIALSVWELATFGLARRSRRGGRVTAP